MDKLVYIDGVVADQIGKKNMQVVVDVIAAMCGHRISLLTHTDSHHHGKDRIRSAPISADQARLIVATVAALQT